MSEAVDPRAEITHEMNAGQVYRDDRSDDMLMVIYIDKQVVLTRDRDDYHRITPRRQFDREVGAGRYVLEPGVGGFGNTGRLSRLLARAEQYEDQGGRRSIHYADALREAVSLLTDDGAKDDNEPIPFEDLDNIGDTAAKNLRKAGFSTKGDIRHADNEELLDVSWVGEQGIEAIREYVE